MVESVPRGAVKNVGVGFGQAVTWNQQDAGQNINWIGGIIAYIPAGESAKESLPENRLRGTRIIFRTDIDPQKDRYLIVVENPVRGTVEFHCRATDEVVVLPWKHELPKYMER